MRDYEFYFTQDGSIGLYSHHDEDVYHSKFGALTEAWEKFVEPTLVEPILENKDELKVLDVCYRIGYNTKALMTCIINENEKFLKKENKIKKIIKNFFKNLKTKNVKKNNNIVSIDTNNTIKKTDKLLNSIETINANKSRSSLSNIKNVKIDCLDINETLIKISPFLKTIITPQEIFMRIVPNIFDCFDVYWKITRFLTKMSLIFAPRNRKEISDLLSLKFSNDYDTVITEHRIHKFVNYILINKLVEKYKGNYFDKTLNKSFTFKEKRRYFDNSMISYAKFRQNMGYKLLRWFNLFTFLHNIYYDHLSKRYKNMDFKSIESLFDVNFYVNDARKTILNNNEEYDLIFLDAFTYSKAPELWSVEFIKELYDRLALKGMLVTYSNSALVRNTFLINNFYVGKIKDKKTGKFIGTVATKDKNLIEYPLSNFEIGLCNTKAGIPYHDYSLNSEKHEILKRREIDFLQSDLISSSVYMRTRKEELENKNE